jgi:choline/glycine/proline betaine transport protein
MENFKETIKNPVFAASSLILFTLVSFAVIAPNATDAIFHTIQGHIVDGAGWFYILTVAIILTTTLYLGVSRYGEIKLGPDHSEPDYSLPSWFAMLFSAGIGIGLLFFGVAEPVMHYLNPPNGDPADIAAAKEALNITFFHWGLHAWSVYAIVGLALAYYGYRHGAPLTLRSTLVPLLGKKIYGPIGDSIDTFAVLGTILGVATSLGFGVAQINAGLGYLIDVPESTIIQLVLMIAITAFAMISVLSGLDKGIRRLSEINMVLAVALLIFVIVIGSTTHIIEMIVQNTGNYLSQIIEKTFNLYAYDPTDWLGGWTIFYWGWWISWSPFVGMFIARISRGRTIRQFVTGVLFVPAGFTFIWMTVFGNTAIDLINDDGMALANAIDANNAVALFKFLEYFPFSSVISFIAVIMIVIFFVTSADSGALVVNMLSSGGNDNTPAWLRVYWTSMIGLIAGILLVSGGLDALQTATIATALPFGIVLWFVVYALLKTLRIDLIKRQTIASSASSANSPAAADNNIHWTERLDTIAELPKAKSVEAFIDSTVKSALVQVAERMEKLGFDTSVKSKLGACSLNIGHGPEIDFFYMVKLRMLDRPDFGGVHKKDPSSSSNAYFRADVYLREGGQDYDLMGLSEEAIINDVIDQYERHRQFLDLIR